MFRFIIGVAVGGIGMYWALTGQIPWRDEVEAWFSRAATSYTAQEHHREAKNVIDERAVTPSTARR
jgi:hypothetical protein